jgi:NDP-sugar pyrophosphorylase family protein
MLHPNDYFDLADERVASLFSGCDYVWEALSHVAEQLDRLGADKRQILGELMPGAHISQRPVYIARGARIEPGAYIIGPAYIGPNSVVRHGAYLRENVILLGDNTVGHASEVKNSIFLPGAAAPHFNYLGDSILGHRVNLGAGTRLSNLTLLSEKDRETGRRPTLKIDIQEETYDTGLPKMGAILGDDSQTGCNAVLNPGCLVGPRTLIYANLSLRKGYYPADSIVKLRQEIIRAERI